jgi:adsorption protein B
VQSLTEDYDIGIRLRARGMREIFVRLPLIDAPVPANGPMAPGRSLAMPGGGNRALVCVREYFPDSLAAAVRQKSRWIVGVAYQGFATHGWTGELALDYFLWRDRKSAISNCAVFAAILIGLQAVALMAYRAVVPDGHAFAAIVENDRPFVVLLAANGVLMANRVAHRVYFVSVAYGPVEGLLSVARLFWGIVINFAANCRAAAQVVRHRGSGPMAWDKTVHEFPVGGEPPRARRPLGRILVEQGAITASQLDEAVAALPRGLTLGSALVHGGAITAEGLAEAVAAQCGVRWEPIETLDLRRDLLRELPEELALHYAVLPIREEGATLVVGSEGYVDPVSLAAMARRLDRPVRYVIVPKGHITVGLRHWHVAHGPEDPRQPLQRAARAGQISEAEAERLWKEYVSRQLLFAEILMSLGHLDPATLGSVLLRHEHSLLSLGECLVLHGIVSPAVLREALDLQRTLQGSMGALLARAGIHVPLPEAVHQDFLSRRRAV